MSGVDAIRTSKNLDFEWTIHNVSRWNADFHPRWVQVTLALGQQATLTPRGCEGRMAVSLRGCAQGGDLTILGPDGSLLFKLKLDPGVDVRNHHLDLKFDEVVARIRREEALYGDRLTLRYGTEGKNVSVVKHSEIPVVEATWKVSLCDLGRDKYVFKLIGSTQRDGMAVMIDTTGQKVGFQLMPFEKKTFVCTRLTLLDREGAAVRTEENEAVVECKYVWGFSNSFLREEVVKRGLSLLLNLKLVQSDVIVRRYMYDAHTFPIELIAESVPERAEAVLVNDLKSIYGDREFSDFEISCDNVTFPVHRNILSARSPVFKSMLSSEMREATSRKANIEDMDSNTLGLFLSFLYTGTVEDWQGQSALKLYYAADKYHVPTLKKECSDHLIANLSVSNVCDVLSVANRHQDYWLTSAAREFILENLSEVLESDEWESFSTSEPLLSVRTLTLVAREKFGEKGDPNRPMPLFVPPGRGPT